MTVFLLSFITLLVVFLWLVKTQHDRVETLILKIVPDLTPTILEIYATLTIMLFTLLLAAIMFDIMIGVP